MTIFGREPAFWIGLGVTIILGAVTTLTGEGVISDALAGKITDGVNAVAQLLVLFAPLIAGVLIRQNVTPTSAPSLPMGTAVTMENGAKGTVRVVVNTPEAAAIFVIAAVLAIGIVLWRHKE